MRARARGVRIVMSAAKCSTEADMSALTATIDDRLDCRAFGELCVRCAEVSVDLGGPKQRLLLTVLMCRANAVVRVEELIDTLWPVRPPRNARKNLQVYVSKLRKVFRDRLATINGGYRLRIGPADCDLLRFEQLARTGRRLARDGDPDAVAVLDRALAEWCDRPLPEFGAVPCVAATADRLTELYLSTLEEWAELAVDEGGHRSVLHRLEGHVRPHALRERLTLAWMRALASAGRVNEALAHFDFVRRMLAEELGVPPSRALARLHERLLRGDTMVWPALERERGAGNQLPRDLPDFVGRDSEIEQVRGRLRGGVLVVSGPVGSGKSAFAVRVAHLLADAFPDGALRVEVGEASTEQVLRDVLDMAGIDSARSALAHWRSWVATRRLLLVLDDVRSEETVRALAPGAGASAVVAVGCHRLSGLESALRVDLPPLTDAQSAELLGRIIGPSRMFADLPATQRIIEFCAGSPLAVRTLGARLDALRHLGLTDFAARLAAAPSPLAELTALRERYESLHRTLSARQRRAYQRLAALPAPITHERAVGALADLPGGPEASLESLFECNLLTVADGAEVSAHQLTYGMSAFARSFGRALG
jgi:DNA-binding SARP family transcriptional activator